MTQGSGGSDRLETLWAGDFGDDYASRNRSAADGRRDFWDARLKSVEVESVLEVGCNIGGNLVWLAEILGTEMIAGVDLNESAIKSASEAIPGADLRVASAYDLPFEDRSFDLTFTTGVLIHVPPDGLERVTTEMVRCSRRYVLCGEYFAPQLEEVAYRGQSEALFKQDYGRFYLACHPELSLVDSGFLSSEDSAWDDVTWWLFEKR